MLQTIQSKQIHNSTMASKAALLQHVIVELAKPFAALHEHPPLLVTAATARMHMRQPLLQRSLACLFRLAIVTKPFIMGALHPAASVSHQLLYAALLLLFHLLLLFGKLQCCLNNVQQHRPKGIGYAGTAGQNARK
jgi:hypothetical protein